MEDGLQSRTTVRYIVYTCQWTTVSNMSEVLKKRTAARGWLTRHAKSLASLNSRVDVDRITLEDAIDLFVKQLESLYLAQAEYEMQLDLEQIEKEIEGAADYRDNVRTHRIEAARLLATLAEKTNSNSDPKSASSTAGAVEANLPKIELPTFRGNLMEWQSFWDQFDAIVTLLIYQCNTNCMWCVTKCNTTYVGVSLM